MKTKSYKDDLRKRLRADPEFAIMYLLAAHEQETERDFPGFAVAFEDVREAYRDKLEEARKL